MANASRAETKTATGLHICPRCGSALVQPTCWEQTADRSRWRLWRRCPECGWHSDGVFGEQQIDAYDQVLDHGTGMLTAELRALERESMERIAESFATALAADLITADDFS